MNKKGSYIVEAAITLPAFIICLVSLALIIRIIGICDNTGFILAKETKQIDLQAETVPALAFAGKYSIRQEVLNNNPALNDFRVSEYDILFSKNGIDDLINIETVSGFTVENPIGVYGRIEFSEKLLTRGYTGRMLKAEPLSAEAFNVEGKSGTVTVFPKNGIRYHSPDCRYVHQEYAGEEVKVEMEAEDAERKGYTPCIICRGGS